LGREKEARKLYLIKKPSKIGNGEKPLSRHK
jgi:hypothetical protein